MHVAAIQMVSGTDLATNLRSADRLLQQAAQQGAELAALPEYFCLLGHKDTDKLSIQEPFGGGAIQEFLSDAAKRYKLWLLGGTLPVSTPDAAKVRNTSLLFDPQGVVRARYDKMHLFSFDNGQESYNESRVLEPGDTPVSCEIASQDGHTWRIGLTVCYDLRFAALYQALHADLLAVPSAFTYTTGQAHWEVLLRARAIENQAYVLAPAQGGTHANGRRTWGHSMVVDAWGAIVNQQASGEAVVCAQLSYAALQTSRRQLPALTHNKPIGVPRHGV